MGIRVTLKALRVNEGLSQAEAAAKVGVSSDTWSNWENSKTFPDVSEVESILSAYGVNYDDIIFLPRNTV